MIGKSNNVTLHLDTLVLLVSGDEKADDEFATKEEASTQLVGPAPFFVDLEMPSSRMNWK